jgi:hypothetical protein
MDFLDTYLDLARRREMDLAREAREARDRRRTHGTPSTRGEKSSSPLGDPLRRTALSLAKLMGTFPY